MTEPRKIRVIPLGGLGEIGKNAWVVESEHDLILLDCGFAFPSEEMYGVDLVLPNFQYVIERADKLRGIFVSHGHEDHIGGLPFLFRDLSRLDVPVYGTPFTLALAERKLNEVSSLRGKIPLVAVQPRERVKVGQSFEIEFIRVCHSIADAVGFAISTEAGAIIYSGDFKMDQTPMDGHRFDFYRFSALGEQGVLLLLSDSTNAEREGMTPSERAVGEGLDVAFHRAQGRIIVSTFSSNVHRIQQVINTALNHGRKVTIAGRSMQQVSDQAYKLGYLQYPEGAVVRAEEINQLPDRQVCIVTTGSQGEPMSGLSRIAHGDHKHINIMAGDTVIFSAIPIPGNEKLVGRTVNKLFSRGAEVIYEAERSNASATQHVSGHASREELKLMLSLTKPRFFVPIHGETKHLVHHAEVAGLVGLAPHDIFILENGDVLELDSQSAVIAGQVPAEAVLVDGSLLRDIGASMLKDRKQLAMDGVVTVAVTIDDEGYLLDGPELMSQGFVHASEFERIRDDARSRVVETLNACRGQGTHEAEAIRRQLKDDLARMLYERSKRRPVIMAMVQVAQDLD